MLICVFTGFASGMPLYLLIQLVPAWLRDSGVSLAEIGLFALVGLPYTWKFLWAPLMDRVTLPLGPASRVDAAGPSCFDRDDRFVGERRPLNSNSLGGDAWRSSLPCSVPLKMWPSMPIAGSFYPTKSWVLVIRCMCRRIESRV